MFFIVDNSDKKFVIALENPAGRVFALEIHLRYHAHYSHLVLKYNTLEKLGVLMRSHHISNTTHSGSNVYKNREEYVSAYSADSNLFLFTNNAWTVRHPMMQTTFDDLEPYCFVLQLEDK